MDYLNLLAAEGPSSAGGFERIMVLIPEVQPTTVWHWLLHNQRGALLDRAIRKHTSAFVCRLRFRLEPHWDQELNVEAGSLFSNEYDGSVD